MRPSAPGVKPFGAAISIFVMTREPAGANTIEDMLAGWRHPADREASFQRIFKAYYRPVYRFFLKRNFPAEESHDLTQETFVRVYQGAETFRGEAPFEAWLFQIAANVYRNTLRHKSAAKRTGHMLALVTEGERDEGAPLPADDSQPDPLDVVLREERVRALREAVESLPEQMRRCVVLRTYQDLSYKEIAVVMRLSVETVKAHLHQARAQLRSKLTAHYGER